MLDVRDVKRNFASSRFALGKYENGIIGVFVLIMGIIMGLDFYEMGMVL